jgi:hypothetical protein
MGGYSLPDLSTFGVQVHQSDSLIGSMTEGTWLPQPVGLSMTWRNITLNFLTHPTKLPSLCSGQYVNEVWSAILRQVAQVDFLHIVFHDISFVLRG